MISRLGLKMKPPSIAERIKGAAEHSDARTGRAPRALRDRQRDCASACYVQATAEDLHTEPSPRYVPNFVRKALGMGSRRTEAHFVPRDANVAAAVLPSLSRTPLPPQSPPTPCQTMCSAYGRDIKHTTQCRVFCADSPRRQHDADTAQIALGGRSAVWHVLITRSRRRDTRVFLSPTFASLRV